MSRPTPRNAAGPTTVPHGTPPASPSHDMNKKRLGRGLAALLGPVEVTPKTVEIQPENPIKPQTEPTTGLLSIKCSGIIPNNYQPRQSFDDRTIDELSSSIAQSGLMQPVVVRRSSGGGYELVAGERRWRAAIKAGLESIPAIVRDLSDEDAAAWAVVENVQREDLNAIDKGWALRRMGERFGLTQEQIAERIGIERSSVANLVRLTELESEVADLVRTGGLQAGHAKVLLALPAGAGRVELAKRAAEEAWSVRQTEGAVKKWAAGVIRLPDPVPGQDAKRAVLADLERRLGQYLGTKVAIRPARGDKGSIELEYYGLDHFDGMLRRMGFDQA